MSQDEIAVMDGGKCILQLRGVRPFLSEKFDIAKINLGFGDKTVCEVCEEQQVDTYTFLSV